MGCNCGKKHGLIYRVSVDSTTFNSEKYNAIQEILQNTDMNNFQVKAIILSLKFNQKMKIKKSVIFETSEREMAHSMKAKLEKYSIQSSI